MLECDKGAVSRAEWLCQPQYLVDPQYYEGTLKGRKNRIGIRSCFCATAGYATIKYYSYVKHDGFCWLFTLQFSMYFQNTSVHSSCYIYFTRKYSLAY